jgi:hypothetical protein
MSELPLSDQAIVRPADPLAARHPDDVALARSAQAVADELDAARLDWVRIVDATCSADSSTNTTDKLRERICAPLRLPRRLPTQRSAMALALGAWIGRMDDFRADCAPDIIERPGGLAVTVADQEPNGSGFVVERGEQVAGLLGDPGAGRVGGDASEVDASGVQLDEETDAQPPQEHGVHGEEITGHDAGCLAVQERPPRGGSQSRRRLEASAQDSGAGAGRDTRWRTIACDHIPAAPECTRLLAPRALAGHRSGAIAHPRCRVSPCSISARTPRRSIRRRRAID